MNKAFYEKHFKLGEIEDCVCTGLDRISFAIKDYPVEDDRESIESIDLPTKAFTYRPSMPKGEYGVSSWDYGIIGLSVEVDRKSDKTIMCEQHFRSTESGLTDWYPIPKNDRGHLAKGLAHIEGDVYAFGMIRTVFKRVGIKQWENITSEKKHPDLYTDIDESEESTVGDWVGFSALDGFNQNDIYAGGNRGDFWHYDGKTWRRKDLPINSDISTIVCAENELVYIACRIGSVLVGRDDRWSIIDESKAITHGTWFKDNIYFVGKNGRIYTHKEDDQNLSEATFKTQYPDYMHHRITGIASCDECLVAYTDIQAYAYDGEIWHEIIEIPSLSKNT